MSVILSAFLYSCSQDDTQQAFESGTTKYANNWIYEQMKRYYYWSTDLPERGNLNIDTKDYFNSLLNAQDRYSYAINLSNGASFPQSLRNSFGFDIGFVEHEGQVFGVVLYVFSDSPGYYAGLRRGHLINKINGTLLNGSNYDDLYNSLRVSQNAQLQVMDYTAATGFSEPYDKNISKGLVLLQPLKSNILQQQNSKIGYIEIPHFDEGLSQSLLNVFLNFKNQSVNEVVVDLRYNGGGDVSSATALAILLAPNIRGDDFFIRFSGNANGGIIKQNFTEALATNEQQVSFAALRSAHPNIQRVYILCGRHTASASEIIINNLRPFTEVITIGEKTMGKDVATFPIEDEQTEPGEDHWVLYPAIYKLFNANGEGNYAAGLAPLVPLDELGELEIQPLGAPGEILLNRALSHISGNGRFETGKYAKSLERNLISDISEPVVVKLKDFGAFKTKLSSSANAL